MEQNKMSDEDRARAFVDSQDWIFAKTMADIPHFYCLKMYAVDPSEFEWFVQHLTTHSVPGWFYTTEYQYFYLDEWKYWIMDASVGECDLINRERTEE